MATLQELKPKTQNTVMALLNQAGYDTSDWKNSARGEKGAASNPKYCYEWAFLQPGEFAVLNLWHKELSEEGGKIYQILNKRNSNSTGNMGKDAKRNKSAQNMDRILRAAYTNGLPVKVNIVDGIRTQDQVGLKKSAARVKYRSLDTVEWAVVSYDYSTGTARVERGAQPAIFIDQFSEVESNPERRLTTTEVFSRSPSVRMEAMVRANGKCEYCGENGFQTIGGKTYLETHHIIPLSENGSDTLKNIIALCPNHHREAHYSTRREQMKAEFQNIVG
jgi:5-methylcytosine-specific restriction protein A